MKKVLIIVAGLIVIIGIGVAIYFFFFSPTAQLSVGNSTGDFPSSGTGPTPVDQSSATGAGTVVGPNLVKITSGAVAAGEVAFDIAPVFAAPTTILSTSTTASSTKNTTSSTTQTVAVTQTVSTPGDVEVRYVDRESGNVYAYRVNARSLTRISDKTLPGIQEASWLPDGSLAFVRFLSQINGSEHINTYALPYNGTNGYFLQQDLSQVFTIGSSSVFTLAAGTDNSVASVARADGSGVQTLFSSQLTSIVARAAGSTVMAVTKATAELDGYAFTLASGRLTPVIGPLRGLTILPSPSGSQVLFSYVDSGTFHMSILDMSSGVVTKLPLATLAEKCTWTSDGSALYCAVPQTFPGTLPDDWYQGVVSFSDRIWRIDLTTRLATLMLDPTQTGSVTIDAVNLTLDPNAQVLVFRNKIDSSLWAYSL